MKEAFVRGPKKHIIATVLYYALLVTAAIKNCTCRTQKNTEYSFTSTRSPPPPTIYNRIRYHETGFSIKFNTLNCHFFHVRFDFNHD